jgi:DNA invertase Pin-like site-specific DNA recombinase
MNTFVTKIGYARTSTLDQNIHSQVIALQEAKCDIIREERKGGSSLDNRPELKNILDFIHPGELLVVTRIDRLARSLKDLQTIVEILKKKGANLYAIEQPVDTSTSTGKAFFDMLGVFAEFETNLRRERQREGIIAAQKRGVYKGKPPKIDKEEIIKRLKSGQGPSQLAREMSISRGSVYKARKLMTL